MVQNNQYNNLIFFDGICNLCDKLVNFIIRNDKKELYTFCSLQSDFAQKILLEYNIKHDELLTVYLIKDGILYEKSNAILQIFTSFNLLWKLSYICYVIPLGIRNALYNVIAKNRYRIFGKKSQCMVYPTNYKKRFID